MSREITLHTVPIVAESTFRQALDSFEAKYNVHVHLQVSSWGEYRQDFNNIALHRLPGDVAISGTPATSDLIAMNALRPFQKQEIASFGGKEGFLPSRLAAGMRPGSSDVWAIPFVVDVRVLYYRRDLLAKARIKEEGAFATPKKMEQTIQQLHAAKIKAPWFTESHRFGVLQRAASWIWSYGGDLFSPDGKRVIFHEAEALCGIRAYLNLARYMPAEIKKNTGRDLLLSSKVGVSIENAFMLFDPPNAQIGCACVPGGSYVGGSDLIIWNHSRNESAAIDLVRYLSQPDVSAGILRESYNLPAHISELQAIASRPGAYAATISNAVFNGRTFPCVPMIGLVEDRLGMALLSVQEELLQDPQADIDKLIEQRIVSLGKRINLTLGNL